MPRVVVIGAGIAGLATALGLARRGHEVTIVERDPAAPPADLEQTFENWPRPGVPQERQSHAFLARLRAFLQQDAPDVLAALYAAGATDIRFLDFLPPELVDREPRPGDDELVALACRRTVFEAVLRGIVASEPTVTIKGGATVTGLVAHPNAHDATASAPVVAGVTVDVGGDGEHTINADVVVDASGRQSGLASWLGSIGARPITEQASECGMGYYTRFYRLRPGAEPPPFRGFSTDAGYLRFGLFPADGPHVSITFAVPSGDADLRRLRQGAAFDAAAALYPATAEWVEPDRSVPTTDVLVMSGLWNRMRRVVVDSEPVVLGLHLVGDSAMHTNPAYGRGATLAFVHAFEVARIIDEQGVDHRAAALALDSLMTTELEPWYQAAATQDPDIVAGWRRHAAGGQAVDDDGSPAAFFTYGLAPASRRDPVVLRAFLRVFNLLDRPADLMSDPDVVQRVMAVYNDPELRHVPLAGPGRDELLKAMADASA